jgi:predicted small lipoprotein YifL
MKNIIVSLLVFSIISMSFVGCGKMGTPETSNNPMTAAEVNNSANDNPDMSANNVSASNVYAGTNFLTAAGLTTSYVVAAGITSGDITATNNMKAKNFIFTDSTGKDVLIADAFRRMQAEIDELRAEVKASKK